MEKNSENHYDYFYILLAPKRERTKKSAIAVKKRERKKEDG
jgi:hypothetical protein